MGWGESKLTERLRYLLDLKKIQQADIVADTSFDHSQVSKWISGKVKNISRKSAIKMVAFFECDLDWLMTGKGEPYPKKQGTNLTITGNNSQQAGRDIHQQAGRDIREKNTENRTQLSSSEQFLLDTLDKLPNKEELLQKFIFESLKELQQRKK